MGEIATFEFIDVIADKKRIHIVSDSSDLTDIKNLDFLEDGDIDRDKIWLKFKSNKNIGIKIDDSSFRFISSTKDLIIQQSTQKHRIFISTNVPEESYFIKIDIFSLDVMKQHTVTIEIQGHIDN